MKTLAVNADVNVMEFVPLFLKLLKAGDLKPVQDEQGIVFHDLLDRTGGPTAALRFTLASQELDAQLQVNLNGVPE